MCAERNCWRGTRLSRFERYKNLFKKFQSDDTEHKNRKIITGKRAGHSRR